MDDYLYVVMSVHQWTFVDPSGRWRDPNRSGRSSVARTPAAGVIVSGVMYGYPISRRRVIRGCGAESYGEQDNLGEHWESQGFPGLLHPSKQ